MTEKISYTKEDIILLHKCVNYMNSRFDNPHYDIFEFMELSLCEFNTLIKLFDELDEIFMKQNETNCKIKNVLEKIIDKHKNSEF